MTNEKIILGALIDIKAWQKIQDEFSLIADIGVRTVDSSGNSFTVPSKQPRLCNELLNKLGICASCLPTFLGGTGVVDRNLSFICQAGLYQFIAPLRAGDTAAGYILIGPAVLVMRKTKEEYAEIAEELNIDLDEFWDALLEVRVISFQGMKALIEFIKDVAEYNLNLAYKNSMAHIEMPAAEPLKLQKIFDLLLDVAFEVSGADIGSIMFADKEEDLTIRASRGIPEEIIAKARVRLGEGISGLAAKEGRPFIIDNDSKDNRIARYLTRSGYISSSMVVPFKMGSRVTGVMNLAALKVSSVRFGVDNLNLINQLIRLVTTAVK